MSTTPSPGPAALQLTLTVPWALVDLIADAVAARLGDGATAASPQSPWLDVSGAAAYLNTTSAAVRKAVQRGLLPGHQPYGPGSRWLFHRGELDAFVLGGSDTVVD
jgi:excisionase family DNA binding protein